LQLPALLPPLPSKIEPQPTQTIDLSKVNVIGWNQDSRNPTHNPQTATHLTDPQEGLPAHPNRREAPKNTPQELMKSLKRLNAKKYPF
jgi:hypothetical protein